MKGKRLGLLMLLCWLGGIMILPGNKVLAVNSTASLTVDASNASGSYLRLEQYNNQHRKTIDEDQKVFLSGLNTKVTRHFVSVQHWYTNQADGTTFDPNYYRDRYSNLDQISEYSDKILISLSSVASFMGRDSTFNYNAFEQWAKDALTWIKQNYSKVVYVEAYNEPDVFGVPNSPNKTIDNYNLIYDRVEAAVKYVNANVSNGEPLKIGGPTVSPYKADWVEGFLTHVKNNNKQADFVAFHDYNQIVDGIQVDIADAKSRISAKGLTAEVFVTEYGRVGGGNNQNPDRHLYARYATEQSAKTYYMLAGGVDQAHFWLTEHPDMYTKSTWVYNHILSDGITSGYETYDFNNRSARYVRLHPYGNNADAASKIKEVQILDSSDNVIPIQNVTAPFDSGNAAKTFDSDTNTVWGHGLHTSMDGWIQWDLGSVKTISKIKIHWDSGNSKVYKFELLATSDLTDYYRLLNTLRPAPYKHVLDMWSRLEDIRISAVTAQGGEAGGLGVRALATKSSSNDKVAILVWNYQNTNSLTYDTALQVNNLPSGFAGKSIKVERYLFDETHSNYGYNKQTSLEKVENATLSGGTSKTLTMTLAPNSTSLIVLSPVTAPGEASMISDYFNSQTAGSSPAGWAVTNDPLTSSTVQAVPSTADKSVKLFDNNPSGKTTAQKSFSPQTGKVTAEWNLREESSGLFTKYFLKNGTTAAVQLFSNSSGLQYRDGSGVDHTITAITPGVWYTVKVVADVASGTCDVYLNGAQTPVLSNVTFDSPVSSIDRIGFESGSSTVGTAYISYVSVNGIPVLNETFNAQKSGREPAGWTIADDWNTNALVQEVPSVADKSLRLHDSNTNGKASATKTFSNQTGIVTAEWELMEEVAGRSTKYYVYRDSTLAVQLFTDGSGDLIYRDGSNTDHTITTIASGTWYKVKVSIDVANDRCDVYLNDSETPALSGITLRSAVTSINAVSFESGGSTIGNSYIDDIKIY